MCELPSFVLLSFLSTHLLTRAQIVRTENGQRIAKLMPSFKSRRLTKDASSIVEDIGSVAFLVATIVSSDYRNPDLSVAISQRIAKCFDMTGVIACLRDEIERLISEWIRDTCFEKQTQPLTIIAEYLKHCFDHF